LTGAAVVIRSGATEPEKTLQDIVLELQSDRNTKENFRHIFETYYRPVFRVFERNGLSADDCRDLTQDVFVSAYCSIATLREPDRFPSWLFCIARNTYKNEMERRRTKKRFALHESQPGADAMADSSADTLTRVLQREQMERLRTALGELPTQMRRCMHLRIVEDCSYEEIASVMGIAVNTVKAHLHQAKKVLKEKLDAIR